MFEIVERHKRTREEKKVILLEILATIVGLGIVGAAVWLLFLKGGG
jgi:hypothetical protein